tara:strand:- start:307 stop:642 length:336 start_codon:yes stop_codon:yes gene_type:complete
MSCVSLLVALSLHAGLIGDYNEVHPHARCEINNVITGAYYNSEEKVSAYIGYQFDMPFNSELEVGLVSGYTGAKVAPMLRFVKDDWFLAPAYETTHGGNWGITFGYEFKLY